MRYLLKKNNVPIILTKLIEFLIQNGLEKEGILRIPGLFDDVESLKNQFDVNIETDISNADCHVIAGLLKLFFRNFLLL